MKNFQRYIIQPLLTLLMVLLYLSCEKDMTAIKPGSNGEEKLLLTGQVVEEQSGSPVAGAVVRALKNQVSDTTGSSGSFRLEGLSPGADTLLVAVPGYLVLQQVVQIEENSQPLTLSLTSVLTRVTLQNQTEHSGIMVDLTELDTFTVTDSGGSFLFKDIADGEYTLGAGYPYFAFAECSVMVQGGSIQTPVDIELQQLLQFRVEPQEITVSIDSLSDIILYVTNLTDTLLVFAGYVVPDIFFAIQPQGFDWPIINPPKDCERIYGTFHDGDLTVPVAFPFPPAKVITFDRSFYWRNTYGCFLIGDYLLFAAYTDLSRFPEYFARRYIWNDTDPLQPVYESMNRSIHKKHALFRPASVHITQ